MKKSYLVAGTWCSSLLFGILGSIFTDFTYFIILAVFSTLATFVLTGVWIASEWDNWK